jgi:tetratricopeptide (TPR) repeat protein
VKLLTHHADRATYVTSVTGDACAEHYGESLDEAAGGGSEVMKGRFRGYRIRALALVIVATGAGCVTDAPIAASEPNAMQTVAMVRAGRFAALNRYYTAVQAGYDKGSVSDERLRSAFRNFYDSSPDLAARYETWIKKMPDSYVAHLARAIYYVRVGEVTRGNLIIADTSEAQLRGMDAAFAVASRELERSLSLERKPLLSIFYRLDIGKFEGDAAGNRELLLDSLAIDPRNFIVREMYVQTLGTAWGGSTEEIRAFVAKCRSAGLSTTHMKDLESFVLLDEAWIDDVDNENYRRAAAEYLAAAKLSGDDACLSCASEDLVKAADFPDAAWALTQYLVRHPESPHQLSLRAYVYFKLGRTGDAVHDCEHAAELGDAYCQYTIGMAYTFAGLGLAKDPDKGLQLLRRAAAQGNQAAKKLLPIALSERLASPRRTEATQSPAS